MDEEYYFAKILNMIDLIRNYLSTTYVRKIKFKWTMKWFRKVRQKFKLVREELKIGNKNTSLEGDLKRVNTSFRILKRFYDKSLVLGMILIVRWNRKSLSEIWLRY